MDSSSVCHCQHQQLPPGFRFHPTDEELIVHYLKRKADSAPLPVSIIAEIDLYKFNPWELPSKASFGEQEWYFFSPRDRKYPNGARPNRAATSGYWKATGTDKPILASDGHHKVGVKKALVFYGGKPPKGVKTNWIMHEYRLADNKSMNSTSKTPFLAPDPARSNKKNSLRLDDWVLCRIYKKSNSSTQPRLVPLMEQDKELSSESMLPMMSSTLSMDNTYQNSKPTCSRSASYGPLGDDNLFNGIIAADQTQSMQNGSDSYHQVSKGNLPMKRALQSQYWNMDTAGSPSPGSSSSSWQFHCDLNNGSSNATAHEGNNSFISLLNHLPHTSTFHPNALLGHDDDGVLRQQFQLPSINWNT